MRTTLLGLDSIVVIGLMAVLSIVVLGSLFLSPYGYAQAQSPQLSTNSSALIPSLQHVTNVTDFNRLVSKLSANQNNFTKLLSEDKTFLKCYPQQSGTIACLPMVYVIYQTPTLLVLDSTYSAPEWMAVDLAQKIGYKVSGVSVYTTHSEISGEDINT